MTHLIANWALSNFSKLNPDEEIGECCSLFDKLAQVGNRARGALKGKLSGLFNAVGSSSSWLKGFIEPAAPAATVVLSKVRTVAAAARVASVVLEVGALVANALLMHAYSKVAPASKMAASCLGLDAGSTWLAGHLFLTAHRGGITLVFCVAVLANKSLMHVLCLLDHAISKLA